MVLLRKVAMKLGAIDDNTLSTSKDDVNEITQVNESNNTKLNTIRSFIIVT